MLLMQSLFFFIFN